MGWELATGQGQRIADRLGLLKEVQKVTTWLWFRQVDNIPLEGGALHNSGLVISKARIS